ncbi:MAG: hypothetical protein R2876_07395 [Eubacteriales bacterium]
MKFLKNLSRRQARRRYKIGYYRKRILNQLKNNKRKIIMALVAVLLAAVLLIVLLSLPKNESEVEESPAPTISSEEIDISDAGVELVLSYKSINNPYIYGQEIVFSCGEANKMNPDLKYVSVVDLTKEDTPTTQLEGIECKFSNLFMPEISDNWIVYIDSNSSGGGRICLYDREAKETYSLRTYYYAMPKVCLSGDFAVYAVQTGINSDKIYLCYLPTQETVLIDQLSTDLYSLGGIYINGNELVWSTLSRDDSDAVKQSVVKRLPLNGSATKASEFEPGSLVYSPKTYGNYVAFLDGNGIDGSRLMISDGTNVAKSIDTGVINFDVGNGFIVYTKQETLHVYFIDQGITATLTSKNSRGLLSSASGDYVCWYDITDGFFERDVVNYAKITVPQIDTEEDSDAQE